MTLALSSEPALAQRRESRPLVSAFPGAIYTTDLSCTVVDQNIYEAKTDVYLTGGGKAVRLPNGSYYVQVTESSGKVVLGSSGSSAPILVIKGKFAACYQLWALVGGFADSRNGEYKVWVCQDATFTHPDCKTDNFRIVPSGIRTATRTPTRIPTAAATNTPTRVATSTNTPTPVPTSTSTPLTPGPGTPTPTAAATATRTPSPPPVTVTPTRTPTATQTPTPIGGTPGVQATATPTPTATPSPIPGTPGVGVTSTPTPTGTPLPGLATPTPTLGPGPGPGAQIPTLSPVMLTLLGLALAALGVYLTRRG